LRGSNAWTRLGSLRRFRAQNRAWWETALAVSVPLFIAALAVTASVYGLGNQQLGDQYGFPYLAYPRIPPKAFRPGLFLRPKVVLPPSRINVFGECGTDWSVIRIGLGPILPPNTPPTTNPGDPPPLSPWVVTEIVGSIPPSEPPPAGTQGYFSLEVPVPETAQEPGWYSVTGLCVAADPSAPGSSQTRLLPGSFFKVQKTSRNWGTLGQLALQNAAGTSDVWLDSIERAIFDFFLSTTTTSTTVTTPRTPVTTAPPEPPPPPTTVAPSTEPPTTDETSTTSTTRCTPTPNNPCTRVP
jgi:hypothetical protein